MTTTTETAKTAEYMTRTAAIKALLAANYDAEAADPYVDDDDDCKITVATEHGTLELCMYEEGPEFPHVPDEVTSDEVEAILSVLAEAALPVHQTFSENDIHHNALIKISGATYRITRGATDEAYSWYLTAEQAHAHCTYRQWPALQEIEVAELLDLIAKHGPEQVIAGPETGCWPTVR